MAGLPDAGDPTNVFVAPGASGVGSLDDPAGLGLLASLSIRPGTNVWLRGGLYEGAFESRSDGTPADPIMIRPYPGERAVIDGRSGGNKVFTVYIEGDYQTWTGLEILNSDPARLISVDGSDNRPSLLHIVGRGTAIINNSIHDGGNCIGWWKSAVDSVVYGNLIYNCGWQGPDRGHGHGVYIQNLDTGRKVLEHNLIGATFGRSVQVYGSTGTHNVDMLGNVIAGGGSLSNDPKSPVYLGANANDLNVVGNHVYSLGPEAVSVVEGSGVGVRLDDNYLMTRGSVAALWVRYTRQVRGSGNHVSSAGLQVRLESTGGFSSWDRNTYYGADLFQPGGGLAGWRGLGYDLGGSVSGGLPTRIEVIPNRYDDDRALVAVWNGSLASSVQVDVSSVLERGDRFQVLDGQDLGGRPVLSGVYDGGTINLPMTGRQVGAPIGGQPAPGWGAEFGTFAITTP